MDKKEFMDEYSDLMEMAAFADACGPMAKVEIFEGREGNPAAKPAGIINKSAAAPCKA